MSARAIIERRLARFARDESGATLVEFALALVIFLLLFFALIDFGRLAFHYVTSNRAMQVAARVAAVRPPACAGVPAVNLRGPVSPSSTAPRYGTLCSAGANICASVAPIACNGTAANATSAEIWALVSGTLPNDATIANLRFQYDYDPEMGFLGGPFTPLVTVELQDVTFRFISPLGALIGLAGGVAAGDLGADIAFPSMSVTLPGEDLALGNAG